MQNSKADWLGASFSSFCVTDASLLGGRAAVTKCGGLGPPSFCLLSSLDTSQSAGAERKEEGGRVGINGPHGRILTIVRSEAGAPGVSKGQD